MYKLLLCWRYLRTRYIALASIISVTLGVATMIVVNSVMSGFTSEMQDRIHGILSDVIFESRSLSGFRDAQWHIDQIDKVAGESIEAMTATVAVPAMLSFQHGGNWYTRQVQLIGIDERTQGHVSDFSRYLQHPGNREQMSFQLRDGGYDVFDHQAGSEAHKRTQMAKAGWEHRKRMAALRAMQQQLDPELGQSHSVGADAASHDSQSNSSSNAPQATEDPPPAPLPEGMPARAVASGQTDSAQELNPFDVAGPKGDDSAEVGREFNPATDQHTGVVLGIALASFRTPEGEDRFLVLPGDDIKLTFPTAGTPPKATSDEFTIVDFYESKMSEYDSDFVFVPIRKLQELRGMIDPETGIGLVNSIQIKLKPGVDGEQVRDKLRAAFAPTLYHVDTWRDKQGPLLAAVQMETAILNVLLFLIIAVAGFGILAIFFMIVVEKTRDIGILKALGASGDGIMGIFLGYGLSLGLVGSGAGLVLGLLFVRYINEIAAMLGVIMGRPVFDPSVYYFFRIPTIVEPHTIAWVVFGALMIAVLAAVLPARRAARLHPVEALRYE